MRAGTSSTLASGPETAIPEPQSLPSGGWVASTVAPGPHLANDEEARDRAKRLLFCL